MTDKFTEEQISEFREAFQIFDKDQDGMILTKELGTVMRGLGQNLSDNELAQMILDVDENGDGTIDFKEFLGIIAEKLKSTGNKQELIEAFKLIDKDGLGALPVYQFRYLMSNSGENIEEEEIDEMIKEADVDGDGTINFDELIRMMSI
jgi:calmodulin